MLEAADAARRATIPNAPRSCSTRSRAKASRSAAGVTVVRVEGDGAQGAGRHRGAAGERDDRRQPSAGRDRPARPTSTISISTRPASSYEPQRHRGRQAAAHHQPARLRHRRRRRRAAVHPCRQLSRRPRDPERAVPPAAPKVERRRDPAGDLHRPGARPGRPDRGARRAQRGHAIRVLRWPYHENDRAQTERETAGHIKVVTNRRGASSAPPSWARRPAS